MILSIVAPYQKEVMTHSNTHKQRETTVAICFMK